MKIKVINRSAFELPHYETVSAAGLDVRANTTESIVLEPLQRALVPTGLYVEIPDGYEIQVRPRSGLAAKHGISIANAPGTIEPDYRGEIKVILVNLSNEPFELKPGERIAQLVVAQFTRIEWESVSELKRNGARRRQFRIDPDANNKLRGFRIFAGRVAPPRSRKRHRANGRRDGKRGHFQTTKPCSLKRSQDSKKPPSNWFRA